MFDRVDQLIVGIIYLGDHDRVFLEAFTCMLDLFQSVRTFATLIQTCTVRCALGGISNAYGARGYYRSVGAPRLFILPLISSVPRWIVPLLFPLTGCVVWLDVFEGAVT